MLLILHGLKSCLYFTGWLSMTLVIFGLILHMFGYILNNYVSYIKSIHFSYFYTHQFSPAAHTLPSLALYPHGVIITFVFSVPYDNISDISNFYQPHIRYGKVLHQIGRMTCDSHHNFVSIQGRECVTNCLNFCTLWKEYAHIDLPFHNIRVF